MPQRLASVIALEHAGSLPIAQAPVSANLTVKI